MTDRSPGCLTDVQGRTIFFFFFFWERSDVFWMVAGHHPHLYSAHKPLPPALRCRNTPILQPSETCSVGGSLRNWALCSPRFARPFFSSLGISYPCWPVFLEQVFLKHHWTIQRNLSYSRVVIQTWRILQMLHTPAIQGTGLIPFTGGAFSIHCRVLRSYTHSSHQRWMVKIWGWRIIRKSTGLRHRTATELLP